MFCLFIFSFSDPSSTKCAVKIPEVPEKPVGPPPVKNATPAVIPAPVPSSPVQKSSSIPVTPKVETPAPPKTAPVPAPVKTNPVPVPSPAKPDQRNNQFGRMEQSQENRSRAPQGPAARVAPPPRSPQPAAKNENLAKASTNFIKRENSYSSEEEEDEDDEDEEDSEIERLDMHSK